MLNHLHRCFCLLLGRSLLISFWHKSSTAWNILFLKKSVPNMCVPSKAAHLKQKNIFNHWLQDFKPKMDKRDCWNWSSQYQRPEISICASCIKPTTSCLWAGKIRVTESWNVLGCKEPQKSSCRNPPAMDREPSTNVFPECLENVPKCLSGSYWLGGKDTIPCLDHWLFIKHIVNKNIQVAFRTLILT